MSEGLLHLGVIIDPLPDGLILDRDGWRKYTPDTVYEWLGQYRDGAPKTLHQTGYSVRAEVALTAYVKTASRLTDKSNWIPVSLEEMERSISSWVRRKQTLGSLEEILADMAEVGLFEVYIYLGEIYVMPTETAVRAIVKAIKNLLR